MEYKPLTSLPANKLASASELSQKYKIEISSSPTSSKEIAKQLECPSFGKIFTDHMVRAVWTPDLGWHNHRVVPYGPYSLDPAASILHYGQEVFEGMKAYYHADGTIWTFRPGFNASRFQFSASRLAIPELSVEDFIGSLAALVAVDKQWVPRQSGMSLYLRPFMFSAEAFLGVHSGQVIEYGVIASPSGAYFSNGLSPVDIWVANDYHRAGPGGTGAAKCGGNYAASLVPQQIAAEKGFSQVLYLDAKTQTKIEELGGMNIIAVDKDGNLHTPALSDSILEGGTRGALLQLIKDFGGRSYEEEMTLDGIIQGIEDGTYTEVLACGTAAVVTPIGRLAGEGFDVLINNGQVGEVTKRLYDTLTGIQWGTKSDPHNWMYRLA